MGAAGRDFHNFNLVFRDDARSEVVAFTAAQIPHIAERWYPHELAGPLYPAGIPIHDEAELEPLIERERIDEVVFAYSDLSHEEVMHRASRALACGADFRLLGPHRTMLTAMKPVVSVCAARTGAGKSPASRRIAAVLREAGLRVGVIRHPMPYGDLARQAVQRFATRDDLAAADCTIEEREEYEPHLADGDLVYAGVDYDKILRLAEAETDILLWDGGNNDWPFLTADVEIVLVDPHRAGHELRYFPGEVNLRRAQVVVLAKLDTAAPESVAQVRANVARANPAALVLESAMPIALDDPQAVRGKRVLVVEDGPTITHGGMPSGAGALAARRFGAAALVDPRPFAVGSLGEVFSAHPHIGPVLPAMGYGAEQIHELEQTIRRTPCDLVLIATPVDLRRVVAIAQPSARVRYAFEERGSPTLRDVLAPVIRKAGGRA